MAEETKAGGGGHDVTGEARDEIGRWTTGGGSGEKPSRSSSLQQIEWNGRRWTKRPDGKWESDHGEVTTDAFVDRWRRHGEVTDVPGEGDWPVTKPDRQKIGGVPLYSREEAHDLADAAVLLRDLAGIKQRLERSNYGVATLPAVYQALLQSHPGLSVEDFHRQLLAWMRDDKLTVGVVNDPRLHSDEERALMLRVPDIHGRTDVRGYVTSARGKAWDVAGTEQEAYILKDAMPEEPEVEEVHEDVDPQFSREAGAVLLSPYFSLAGCPFGEDQAYQVGVWTQERFREQDQLRRALAHAHSADDLTGLARAIWERAQKELAGAERAG